MCGTPTPCKECGEPLAARSRSFCSTKCRKAFNNRRAVRGAQLYDLFMANEHQRELRSELHLLTMCSRMARQFRDEDLEQRDGRHSWHDAKEVLSNRPDLKVGVSNMKIGRAK